MLKPGESRGISVSELITGAHAVATG